MTTYRGRLAPSPTGFMHLGHARTFWIAHQRAASAGGALILRNEDLDRARCQQPFVPAMLEDLRWLGLKWSEGPDVGGPHTPYDQSGRMTHYTALFDRLRAGGFLYPCTCSRQDVQRALTAPHAGEDEPIYPGTCRPPATLERSVSSIPRAGVNWRFRLPEGERIAFQDGHLGPQAQVAGRDFGDFIVWRKDDFPAYQLAVVADDAAMGITEVVRGADLIASTFRQLAIYEALRLDPPAFYHCELVKDEHGVRLAKRDDARSLRTLRQQGCAPEAIVEGFQEPIKKQETGFGAPKAG